jgi:hypothetical protein
MYMIISKNLEGDKTISELNISTKIKRATKVLKRKMNDSCLLFQTFLKKWSTLLSETIAALIYAKDERKGLP